MSAVTSSLAHKHLVSVMLYVLVLVKELIDLCMNPKAELGGDC